MNMKSVLVEKKYPKESTNNVKGHVLTIMKLNDSFM